MENPNKKIKIEDGFIFSFEDTIKEEKDIKIEPISDVEDEEDDDDPVIFTPKEKPGRKTRLEKLQKIQDDFIQWNKIIQAYKVTKNDEVMKMFWARIDLMKKEEYDSSVFDTLLDVAKYGQNTLINTEKPVEHFNNQRYWRNRDSKVQGTGQDLLDQGCSRGWIGLVLFVLDCAKIIDTPVDLEYGFQKAFENGQMEVMRIILSERKVHKMEIDLNLYLEGLMRGYDCKIKLKLAILFLSEEFQYRDEVYYNALKSVFDGWSILNEKGLSKQRKWEIKMTMDLIFEHVFKFKIPVDEINKMLRWTWNCRHRHAHSVYESLMNHLETCKLKFNGNAAIKRSCDCRNWDVLKVLLKHTHWRYHETSYYSIIDLIANFKSTLKHSIIKATDTLLLVLEHDKRHKLKLGFRKLFKIAFEERRYYLVETLLETIENISKDNLFWDINIEDLLIFALKSREYKSFKIYSKERVRDESSTKYYVALHETSESEDKTLIPIMKLFLQPSKDYFQTIIDLDMDAFRYGCHQVVALLRDLKSKHSVGTKMDLKLDYKFHKLFDKDGKRYEVFLPSDCLEDFLTEEDIAEIDELVGLSARRKMNLRSRQVDCWSDK